MHQAALFAVARGRLWLISACDEVPIVLKLGPKTIVLTAAETPTPDAEDDKMNKGIFADDRSVVIQK
jgi:hypothetical protein